MSRIILNYLLPLVLPVAIYLTYMWWQRRHAKKNSEALPVVEHSHVFVSVLIGFVLMASSLTWIAVVSGVAPGEGEYQSPHYQDGKIIPPSFK